MRLGSEVLLGLVDVLGLVHLGVWGHRHRLGVAMQVHRGGQEVAGCVNVFGSWRVVEVRGPGGGGEDVLGRGIVVEGIVYAD